MRFRRRKNKRHIKKELISFYYDRLPGPWWLSGPEFKHGRDPFGRPTLLCGYTGAVDYFASGDNVDLNHDGTISTGLLLLDTFSHIALLQLQHHQIFTMCTVSGQQHRVRNQQQQQQQQQKQQQQRRHHQRQAGSV